MTALDTVPVSAVNVFATLVLRTLTVRFALVPRIALDMEYVLTERAVVSQPGPGRIAV